MSRQERDILERAVHSISEQPAAGSGIVVEALESGLDGSHRLTVQAKIFRHEGC